MRLTIAAAQSRSVPGDVARNIAHHARIAEIAATHGAKLLVFPELSLTGYELALARGNAVDRGDAVLRPLRELAVRSGITIAAGAPVPGEHGDLHIAALCFLPDGAVTTYTKVHVHESELGVFTFGHGGAALRVEDATVAMAICRDASFPEHAAAAASLGANVYAASAMIDVPAYERKAALLEGYARDHGMAVLLANYAGTTGGDVSAGRSALWSETGALVAACPDNAEALVIGTRIDGAWSGSVLTV